jgi:multidrug efflux pump subunit AcrB
MKALDSGITQLNVASNLLVSLSGSFQTTPQFFLDPRNGVSYNVVTQTPQPMLTSLADVQNIPVAGDPSGSSTTLREISTTARTSGLPVVSHYDIQRAIDIFGAVQGRDLGGVATDVQKIVDESAKDLPRGSRINLRGQIETMRSSFLGLLAGLTVAIVLVYLLIVVTFQSWLDPFIIITALPAALAGIVLLLFLTGTTMSVPALMGAIMSVGVATANSILVVSFAKERLDHHGDPGRAAVEAGFTRLRPVLMTAFAMIIGMIPMALGLGEGGEQNAPLGRAVIGGLSFATVATLFFVPVVFSLFHRKKQVMHVE